MTQGTVIAYVGMTGLATGPHLHYEYRVNGVFKNPQTVSLPGAPPIDARWRADFLSHAAALAGEPRSAHERAAGLALTRCGAASQSRRLASAAADVPFNPSSR